jgi:hypothetical protein
LAAATWPLKSRVSRTDQAAGSSNYSSCRNNNKMMMFMMMSKMLQGKTSADIISNPVLNSFQVCTTSASSSSELHHHVQHHHPMSRDIASEPVFELFECFV